MMNGKQKLAWQASLLLSIWLAPSWLAAQTESSIFVQEWTNGKVVLTTGESIDGAIAYHRNIEVIKVYKEDGSVKSYSPVNVSQFVAADSRLGKYNVFQTLRWNQGNSGSDFKKPAFFEVLQEGTYSLIARSTYARQKLKNVFAGALFSSEQDAWREEIKMTYYVKLPDGEILRLRKIKRDLFSLSGDHKDKLKSYIKENKLDVTVPYQLSAVINYLNQLGVPDLEQKDEKRL